MRATQFFEIFGRYARPKMQRGYYVSPGAKFGGTFLVYPGEPLRFHAEMIVNVVEPEAALWPLDIVATGRMGVTVKKKTVYASLVEGTVQYVSVGWQGVT